LRLAQDARHSGDAVLRPEGRKPFPGWNARLSSVKEDEHDVANLGDDLGLKGLQSISGSGPHG
jgi:hypothetical protein